MSLKRDKDRGWEGGIKMNWRVYPTMMVFSTHLSDVIVVHIRRKDEKSLKRKKGLEPESRLLGHLWVHSQKSCLLPGG